jgi:histidinol-phosphate aminotransferase
MRPVPGSDVDSALRIVRDVVREVRPYHLDRRQVPVKLDQNESAYPLPDSFRHVLEDALRNLEPNRYPALVPVELQEALGSLHDWPAEGVVIGNGSNELLLMLALATLEEGRTVVLPTPSFSSFAYVSRLMAAAITEVPPAKDLVHRADSFIGAIGRVIPSLVFLCSPNNPTGAEMKLSEIERVARVSPGLLVIDEAYLEFSQQSAREILAEYPRTVLLRTFSKAAGLAGLRIGYILAHPEVASEIRKTQLPYAVNQFSRIAALEICRQYSMVRARANEIIEARERLYRELCDLRGIRPYPSSANFVLFDCAAGAHPVFEGLLSRGVLVRDLSSHPHLPHSLRVTVGLPEENARFLAALTETVEELG